MAATGPNNSPQTTKDSASSCAAAATIEQVTENNTKEMNSTDMTQSTSNAVTPAAAAATAATSSTSCQQPNYFTTKTSKAYTLAYQLLNSDNFPDALSTLETALEFTVDILRAQTTTTTEDAEEDTVELHESLAPLYYLYGSTLLYSVEESDVMMASSAPPAAASADGGAPDLLVGNNDDEDEAEMMSKKPSPQQEQEEPASSDPTEDLQIAWENLETARSIVTRVVESFHPLGELIHNNNNNTSGGKSEYIPQQQQLPITTSYTTQEQSDLLLDLAQIHTRLGDLQRGNNTIANTSDCISDYTTALQLRLEVLGKYDKKVADSHYSLANVYAEAPSKSGEEVDEAVDRFVSQLGGGGGESEGRSGGGKGGMQMTESEKMEYRERSLEHYVQCAVSFSGVLASMCGEDGDTLTTSLGGNETAACATAAAAASATSSADSGGIHSTMLSTLRSRVSSLTPPTKSPEKESFEDIVDILDEIQEAVDTAEEAEEGLRTLGEMKANEIRKHEAKMNGGQGGDMEEEEVGDGGMTTIGFGASAAVSAAVASGTVNVFDSAASGASTSVNAFGSAAAETAASAAKPMMMVVKKKKKVQPVLIDADSAKRAKTE